MHAKTAGIALLFAGLFLGSCTKTNEIADATPGESDGAASIDASDVQIDASDVVCPTATHQCVAESPGPDWLGPVVRASAALPGVPTACGANYDSEAAQVFSGLNATGTCTCSCSGNTTGTVCGNATVRGHFAPLGNEAPCSAPISGATDSLPPNGTCTSSAMSSNAQVSHVQVTLGTVTTQGTCGETPAVTDSINAATWTTTERFCEVETPIAATCDNGNACTPLIDNGFDDELCIYRAGVHTCDTESDYPETFVRYQGIDDQRSCGSCSCSGPLTGSTCSGAVLFGQTLASCNGGAISTGGCISDPYAGAGDGARFSASTTFSCSESGGGVDGIASGSEAITFCCQAAGE